MLILSFMLFSLFFGAGNLIFPPFLGQSAGENTPVAILAFLITAVVLPVLGVIVVAKFDGLDKLGGMVGSKFAMVFTILIYLSIGPGLGIPRAGSVPFEMAVLPYLPEGFSSTVGMLIYSVVFFLIAGWVALTPSKLINRIGKFLSPTLLILLFLLFVSFLLNGHTDVGQAVGEYQTAPAVKGFLEGYQTMDTIAALNFGLVIAVTLRGLHITEKKDVMSHTVKAGIVAGTILALVYLSLAYMGMQSSGVYPLQENGAWTLRAIVSQLFGEFGAILLAAIFTLACLTTCTGLITSISQFFSKLFPKISYKKWVCGITLFSLLVCNLGLNVILSLSVPVLDAIYPVSIVLIVLGLLHEHIGKIPRVYPITIGFVTVCSVLYSLEKVGLVIPFVSAAMHYLPLYALGLGWVCVAVGAFLLALLLHGLQQLRRGENRGEEAI